MEKILDYQEFYDALIDNDIIPARIDYQWSSNNEDFMRETLFLFYTMYSRLNNPELLMPMLKLYGEVILSANIHYPSEETFL